MNGETLKLLKLSAGQISDKSFTHTDFASPRNNSKSILTKAHTVWIVHATT